MSRHFKIFILLALLGGACRSTGHSSAGIPAKFHDPQFIAEIKAAQNEDFLKNIPKISAHEHFKAGADPRLYFQAMDLFNIEKVVFLPTGGAPDNQGYKENMKALLEAARQYPDKIIPFASVDDGDPGATAVLEQAVREGARGLKLLTGHPHFYEKTKRPLDQPNMMALFKKADELKIPVLIHISPGKYPSQNKEFIHLVSSFPDLTVIAAHYGRLPPDFKEAGRWLDTYPNLFMDVSMGGGLKRYQKEMQKGETENYRNFVLKYQDRLMWGTDVILNKKMKLDWLRKRIAVDYLLLGKEVYVDPRPDRVYTDALPGLDLPDDVLRKIFYENPKKILRL